MAESGSQVVILDLGRIDRGHLTNAKWLDILGLLRPYVQSRKSIASVTIDLTNVVWIDHLPLLAVCMLVDATLRQGIEQCIIKSPSADTRRAFLARWGFYDALARHNITIASAVVEHPYSEAEHSRVLPIRCFANHQDALAVRDSLLNASGDLRDVLEKNACLSPADVVGLSELIIYELCKNTIEHSRSEFGGYIIAHASTPSAELAKTRNQHAAPWELAFYNAIGDEGVTEIVLGDAGIGVAASLREAAQAAGLSQDRDILQYAFEPYSTSKRTRADHTRGLWCVKQKVRELGGLLYMRTADIAPDRGISKDDSVRGPDARVMSGHALFWDFLSEPDAEEPHLLDDACPSGGTQYHIILPQRDIRNRPRTYVALHVKGTAGQGATALTPVPFVVPREAPGADLVNAIRRLDARSVLFLDMSAMDPALWDRAAVDHLLDSVCRELLAGKQRRVWIINPPGRIREYARASASPSTMWKERAVLLPLATLESPEKPPQVSFLCADVTLLSGASGDSRQARQSLVDALGASLTGAVPVSDLGDGLSLDERGWLAEALSRNYSVAQQRRVDGSNCVIPAFDLSELATVGGMMTLETEVTREIECELRKRAAGGPLWYRLTSGLYSKEYIEDRILFSFHPWLRARIDAWLEKIVRDLAPGHIVSYTEMGNELLAHAHGTGVRSRLLYLGSYLDVCCPDGLRALDEVPKDSDCLLLVDISGSGATIARIADYLTGRNVRATVLCIIDTMSNDDYGRYEILGQLRKDGRFIRLVSRPIMKVPRSELPALGTEGNVPIVSIDPRTLLPVAQTPETKIMTDGAFWSAVARSGGLTTTPLTYKGHEFGSFIWLRGLFNDPGICDVILKVLRNPPPGAPGKEGAPRPDCILIEESTAEWLVETRLHKVLVASFGARNVVIHGRRAGQELAVVEDRIHNRNVAIFIAAATSGSGVAEMLAVCKDARTRGLFIFVDRMAAEVSLAIGERADGARVVFQRLYSASPGLVNRSYRSAAIRQLETYRRATVSSRLALFINEAARGLMQRRTFLESPAELVEGCDLLLAPARADLFDEGASYDSVTRGGQDSLVRMARGAREGDTPWIRAILQEAACQVEIVHRGQLPDEYFNLVGELYRAARESSVPRDVMHVVLDCMVLERLPGQSLAPRSTSAALAELLWADFVGLDVGASPGLRAIVMRALAKLNPTMLLERLPEAVRVASQDGETELTLALELAKLRDKPAFVTSVNEALVRACVESGAGGGEITTVARCVQAILRDLSLAYANGCIVAMRWGDVLSLLRDQAPDHSRTVRAIVRAIHAMLPESYIAYYQELSRGSFLLSDGWPRERGAGPIPAEGALLANLLVSEGALFSPDILRDGRDAVREYAAATASALQRLHASTASLIIREFGSRESSARRRGARGIFRVVVPIRDEGGIGIDEDAFRSMDEIFRSGADVAARPEPAIEAQVGGWQYQEALLALERSQTGRPHKEEILALLVTRVASLLNADIGRVAEYSPETQSWRSVATTGDWEGSAASISIGGKDDVSATVRAARDRRPEVIADVRRGEVSRPPNTWVHSCVAIPLLRHQEPCSFVLTLWHHTENWFGQFSVHLLESIGELGGAVLYLSVELDQEVRHGERQKLIDSVARGVCYALRSRVGALEAHVALIERDLGEGHAEAISGIHKAIDFFKRTGMLTAEHLRLIGGESLGEVEVCDLNAIVMGIAEAISDPRVQVETCEQAPTVHANADRVEDAILELVNNGCDFAPPDGGQIVVRVSCTEGFVCVLVSDNGPGVHPDLAARLFTMFSCWPADRIGLGLSYARSVIETYGGTLEHVAERGPGAHFLIRLPLERSQEHDSRQAHAPYVGC